MIPRLVRACVLIAATAGAASLAGCGAEPMRTVPHEHEARTDLPGGIPEQASEHATIGKWGEPSLVIVDRAPPVPPIEHPPYDDWPEGHVWIPGYWRWDTGLEDHVWVPGGWMRPPPERAWIAPRWVEVEGGRYRFLAGYWR